jgi:glutamine synthetase
MSAVPATVLSTVRGHDVRFVRFVMADNAGLIRAKAVHTRWIEDSAQGIGITVAQQALPVMYDAVAADSGLTPAGDVFMCADWETFRILPYAPGHARVLTDIYDGDRPWAHCPRSFLRRMIARAAGQGLHIKAAFENEFYLLRPEAREPTPVDPTVFAQTYALDVMAPVLDHIAAALEAQGVLPEQVYSESGAGQFEIPVRYTGALGAADQQIVFRETVRAVAHADGLIASFVPKIFANQAGNGSHLHFSLWEGDENLIPSRENSTSLSSKAASFVAGVLHHLPALTTLTTPSPNSFKRVRPRSWAGAFACWGYGNREGAVRVPQQPSGPITNVELKTVDSTCNPYLALGAVMAAGLDGLERGMAPPDPIQKDPADLSEGEREALGARRLPSTLGEAIDALQVDAVLADALGADLYRSFVAVRKMEWEALKDVPHEEEVRLLLERY